MVRESEVLGADVAGAVSVCGELEGEEVSVEGQGVCHGTAWVCEGHGV